VPPRPGDRRGRLQECPVDPQDRTRPATAPRAGSDGLAPTRTRPSPRHHLLPTTRRRFVMLPHPTLAALEALKLTGMATALTE